jgi:methionyl-tRNA formyltransferase
VPSLEVTAAATRCGLVVTQPDRPAGRGKRLQASPVKLRALELGLEVAQPDRLSELAGRIAGLSPDLYVVASYGKILPQATLDGARLGALNVHPSLLPLYRGATPLQSQLRDGVRTGGVTIILMDRGMDTGDIVAQREAPIEPDDTYGTLHDRFAALGASLLGEAIEDLRLGKLRRTPQAGLADPAAIAATMTRALEKDDLTIDWSRPAAAIVNLVRSLAPEPLARAHFDGVDGMVKIVEAVLDGGADRTAMRVRAGDGTDVALRRVIPPSRPEMSGADFEAGLRRRTT